MTNPSGTDKTIIIDEDVPYTLLEADFGFSDPDIDAFLGVIIVELPANGTLKLNGIAVAVDDVIEIVDLPGLVWTPDANANGAGLATLKFKVVDASGTDDTDLTENTIIFDVAPVNDPAVIEPWTTLLSVFEDGLLEKSVSFTVFDPDPGETGFTISTPQYGTIIATQSGASGTVTYQLNNSLLAVQLLGSGGFLQDTFKIVSLDGTEKTVRVIIHGRDGPQIDGNENENDHLVGTFESETISGKGGNDVISGDLEGDRLYGGSGDDWFDLGAHVPVAIQETSEPGSGVDTVTSTITRSLVSYSNVENLVLLGAGAISGTGNSLANTLDGSQNGSANVLTGLSGDDVYFVGAGDEVVETENGGTDWVVTTLDYTLGANVEHLELQGAAAIDGTGNGLANVLYGKFSSGANTLTGLGGDDAYFVGAGDIVVEAANAGTEWIISEIDYALTENVEYLELRGSTSVSGTGNGLGNRLSGRLNSAANTLTGLAGDDIYLIGAGDTVVEAANSGIDVVVAAFDYTLGANVEDLELTGAAAVSGTGNGLANRLDGRFSSGANTLRGLGGNDIYLLGAGDIVVEAANSGTDLIVTTFNYTLGANVENLELDGTAAISGTGNGLANRLDGRFNNAVNTLIGLGGNDVYFVGAGDIVVEQANGGTEWVVAAFNHTLRANVENLELSGAAAVSGTGNNLANRLDGRFSSGANRLTGLTGNDVYFIGAGDTVVEAASGGTEDWVVVDFNYTLGANIENIDLRGAAAITGTGNALANQLDGRFNTKANTLIGLAGNDVYFVGAGDKVIESANGGTDWVVAAINYTLTANVEKLELGGSTTIRGTGNNLGNTLSGYLNRAANMLVGLGGNDVYYVGAGDKVVEATNGGADWVVTKITYTLGANVENLELISTLNQNGTGNALANEIVGNARINRLDGGLGADRLNGFAGNDTLIGNLGADLMVGGAGNDVFRFNRAADSIGKIIDSIQDFDDFGNDTIDVSALFGARMAYIHNKAFTKAGQVRISDIAGVDVVVEVNAFGSLAADFAVRLKATTLISMTATDFLL